MTISYRKHTVSLEESLKTKIDFAYIGELHKTLELAEDIIQYGYNKRTSLRLLYYTKSIIIDEAA